MENFENKRILMVCREVYSYPFYFLADRWKEKNALGVYFFSPSEVRNSKNPSNEYSYYAFKDSKDVKIYTTLEMSNLFEQIQKRKDIIDEEYLAFLEDNYTHYLNLNAQIVSTQSFTRHFHFRNYWSNCTYAQQMNWLILNYKDVIKVIEDFKPDIVLDCDFAELGRCVMREVCYKNRIPYLCIEHPRYETFKIITYSLGLKISNQLQKKYNDFLCKSKNELADEFSYVENFRKKHSIMHSMYKNNSTTNYHPDGFLKSLKIILGVCWLMFKQDFIAKNYHVKKRNQLLHSNSLQFIWYFIKLQLKKEYLLRKNKYFTEPVEGEKYVYMPLHLIPESTTFSLAPFYINELSIIEAISKSLPAGWKLYVKEHQAMVGERSLSFYKKVNSIPNAQMVQLNFYLDPKPWIAKSQGVVTISGTSAYEAALLGKHAIIFSDVPFGLIEGINRVCSFEKLPYELQQFKEPLDNMKSCAAYIAAVKAIGKPVDLIEITRDAPKYISKKEIPNSIFLENISNLEQLFFLGNKLCQTEFENQ